MIISGLERNVIVTGMEFSITSIMGRGSNYYYSLCHRGLVAGSIVWSLGDCMLKHVTQSKCSGVDPLFSCRTMGQVQPGIRNNPIPVG